MNTEHVREFLVFSKSLNYTSAAKLLYMSTATLSAHIDALEKEVGTPLVRKGGTFSLTPAGKVFVQHGKKVLDQMERLLHACESASGSTIPLRIAGASTAFETLAWQANASLAERSGTLFEVDAVPQMTQGPEAIAKFDADLAFWSIPCDSSKEPEPMAVEGFLCTHLKREPLLFSIPSGNRLFDVDPVRVEDFEGESVLYVDDESWFGNSNAIERAFRDAGVSVSIESAPLTSPLEYLFWGSSNNVRVWVESSVENLDSQRCPTTRFVKLDALPLAYDTYTVLRADDEREALRDLVNEMARILRQSPPR